MKIRKEGGFWLVSIEPNELMVTASRAYPHGGTIGTINARGTINIWRPAISGTPRNWNEIVRIRLEDARRKLYQSGELIDRKAVKARKEEARTGSFLVRVSIPSTRRGRHMVGQSRFHSMSPAMKWADEALKNRPAGSRAEFYRAPPAGVTQSPWLASPWTEPFQVHEINEHGHIRMGGLSPSWEMEEALRLRGSDPARRVKSKRHVRGGKTSRRDPAKQALTEDQRLAILAYAKEKGRMWKQRLRDDWYSASARIGGEPSPELQQIRNTLGPSWLNRVSLKELIRAPWQSLRDPDDKYRTHGKGKLKRQIGVIGNAMWRLPAPSPYVIYWNGPGARLLFGTNKPGSQLTPIDHPTADGNYRSLKEAQAAVTRFWKP